MLRLEKELNEILGSLNTYTPPCKMDRLHGLDTISALALNESRRIALDINVFVTVLLLFLLVRLTNVEA